MRQFSFRLTHGLVVMSATMLVLLGCAQEEALCRTPTVTITLADSFTGRGFTRIDGTVTCSTTGAPLPGLTVVVTFPDTTTASVITNAQGNFSASMTKTFAAGAADI